MIALPNCVFCRHSRLPASENCAAFPSGIPAAILIDGYDHRKPYPGDHGILFEPKSDAVSQASPDSADSVPVKAAA
jgi:hypothetical protein